MDEVQENGTSKQVNNTYLVEALSVAEAQQRVIDEVAPFVSGDFDTDSITRANLADVLLSNDSTAELFFQATMGFITLDEKTGKEKMAKQRMLVQAANFDDAVSRLKEEMKNWMGEVVMLEMKLTNYVDYFSYKPKQNEE